MSREMKESGVDWIGVIPKDWKVMHCNSAFIRKNRKAEQDDPIVLSLARSGVRVRDISNNDGQLAESYYNYNPVEPGDLLLNPMDLVSGANCSISEVSGVISPAYVNLKARNGFDPLYYDYYFKTQYWSMAFFAHGKGVSFDNRWGLSAGDILHYLVPVPPEGEQKRIATYLKKKCNEIDKVITDTERSIEEYKKLKQSIITETVTKGLNRNTEMKESGVDWMGKIPIDWQTCKLFYCLRSPISDGPHETPNYLDDGIPFISVDSLDDTKDINLSVVDKYISEEDYERFSKKAKLEKDDILFTKAASIGKTAIVKDEKFMVWSPIAIIKANNKKIDNLFLYYLLNCQDLIQRISLSGSFNTQVNVGMREMERAIVPLPNLDTQREIALYLDNKTKLISKIIIDKQLQLKHLMAYKKSIIYEYVTGKKEVPEQ